MKTARKSAPKKTVRKGKVKAKPARSSAKKTTPKPTKGLEAIATTPAAQLADPKAESPKEPERQFSHLDFRMSIDDMEPARLRAYARYLGILQRDVDGLTENRLRQNCKARVFASLED
jgi:hypothetical protein